MFSKRYFRKSTPVHKSTEFKKGEYLILLGTFRIPLTFSCRFVTTINVVAKIYEYTDIFITKKNCKFNVSK